MKHLDGRVAIVTGAATGVGLGIAEVLAQERASVVVADLDAEAAERSAAALRDAGHDAWAVGVDVVDRGQMDAMAAAAIARYGRIDIVAANAGIYPPAPLDQLQDADWDRVMAINVKGAVHSIQACLSAMREQHYGRIVLTSSITGPLVGAPELTAYAASKSAMLGLMRSAALELVDTASPSTPSNRATSARRESRRSARFSWTR